MLEGLKSAPDMVCRHVGNIGADQYGRTAAMVQGVEKGVAHPRSQVAALLFDQPEVPAGQPAPYLLPAAAGIIDGYRRQLGLQQGVQALQGQPALEFGGTQNTQCRDQPGFCLPRNGVATEKNQSLPAGDLCAHRCLSGLLRLLLTSCYTTKFTNDVTPAKAGVQFEAPWIPAFAGMTHEKKLLDLTTNLSPNVKDATLARLVLKVHFALGPAPGSLPLTRWVDFNMTEENICTRVDPGLP